MAARARLEEVASHVVKSNSQDMRTENSNRDATPNARGESNEDRGSTTDVGCKSGTKGGVKSREMAYNFDDRAPARDSQQAPAIETKNPGNFG